MGLSDLFDCCIFSAYSLDIFTMSITGFYRHLLCFFFLFLFYFLASRVKSGIFGQTAKSGQQPCLFHSSNIGIKIN